jgi:tetratricopeptide (TPR) repeat protein
MTTHSRIIGPHGHDQDSYDVRVDCHRRLRGAYTGLGSLLRAVVPGVYRDRPELVRSHAIEILTAAPELKAIVGVGPQTLTSLAIPKERTRLYPANRTRRLAHGCTEFLDAYAAALGLGRPLTLCFDRVDEADHTDQEFLAILLRRARPERIAVTVRTGGADLIAELAEAVAEYAVTTAAPAAGPPAGRPDGQPDDQRPTRALALAYVLSDGTSPDPAERAAYDRTDPAERARMHDLRADELSGGEWSLQLGARLYHLEHGSDRAKASEAFMDAVNYVISMGFYHALIDLTERGAAVTDPVTETDRYWQLCTKTTTALSVLDRPEEAERLYTKLRAQFTLPMLHIFSDYALGMIYTRYFPTGRKNHLLAKAHLNNAIAIASLLVDHEDRVFQSVFNRNGLALVEMHLGNLPESLRLVDEGLAEVDRELPSGTHRLHRSVLVHNRGRVYAALGRMEEALTDISTVIEVDPNYPDYYFDRADVRRRLGDPYGAIDDYNTAITLSAPFWELYYNRADVRLELGDLAGAVTDLAYVLELEPGELDARINLASLLRELEDADGSRAQVEAGLARHPGNARLLSARGLLALDAGAHEEARRDFDLALAAEPGLVSALANRATLALESGDLGGAVDDLTLALAEDADNPDLLYNRGYIHQQSGDWESARRDYTAALLLPDADRVELLRLRAECHAALGDPQAQHEDLLAAGPEPESQPELDAVGVR